MLETSVDREAIMTEQTMIERVARAIDPFAWYPDCADPKVYQEAAMKTARKVIEAMREPTNAMVEAELDLGPDHSGDTYYAAMIDAALK